MSITSISRDWGSNPSIVRMVSSDNLSTVTTAGYLADQATNIETINSGEFQWEDSDLILLYYATDQLDFFRRDAATDSLVIEAPPGSLSNVLASGRIFVGNGSNVATPVLMSGDVTIDNTGAATIANDSIVNAMVDSGAAIAFSKLAALASGNILVGNGSNVAASVALSGDATMANTGAITIANNAVTTAKILNANVTLAKLASGITPSHIVKFAGQPTTVGGAAAEAFTVTGAAATDLAFVQVVNNGTNNVTVLQAVATLNTLTVTFSGDPAADTVINYQLLRAAS